MEDNEKKVAEGTEESFYTAGSWTISLDTWWEEQGPGCIAEQEGWGKLRDVTV